MDAGAAPVDMIPAINAVGSPEVVLPVPMYPKFGSAVAASVELPAAASPTLVTAPIEPDVPINDPADNPAEPRSAAAPVPALLSTLPQVVFVTNDPASNPPVLKKDRAINPTVPAITIGTVGADLKTTNCDPLKDAAVACEELV